MSEPFLDREFREYEREQADTLKREIERLQRARISDSEIIGRWQCEAESLRARMRETLHPHGDSKLVALRIDGVSKARHMFGIQLSRSSRYFLKPTVYTNDVTVLKICFFTEATCMILYIRNVSRCQSPMSQNKPNRRNTIPSRREADALWLAVACPFCGAPIGRPCRRPINKPRHRFPIWLVCAQRWLKWDDIRKKRGKDERNPKRKP